MKTNCPNCGAPIDIGENKCLYCGTSYFDLTSIDFDSGAPVFLKIKTNGCTITQKVIPRLGEISISSENDYIYGGRGNKLIAFQREAHLITNIEFQAVEDNGIMCKVEKT